MLATRVAVWDDDGARRRRTQRTCVRLGYRLQEARSKEELIELVAGAESPDLLMVAIPGGEQLVAAVRARPGRRTTIIATLDRPAATAPQRCEQAEADVFAVHPLRSENVAGVLRAAGKLATARALNSELQRANERLRDSVSEHGARDAITGFRRFDSFKEVLVAELKRARRYQYSIAACVVCVDRWEEHTAGARGPLQRQLRTRVAGAINASTRDIDYAVDLAEERFLVFLPHTDLPGAEQVGKRIVQLVGRYGRGRAGAEDVRLTVSVGVAAARPGRQVSFAKLMRDAQVALRVAQKKGGGQVVVRTVGSAGSSRPN